MDKNIIKNIEILKKSAVGNKDYFIIKKDTPDCITQWLRHNPKLQGYFNNFDFCQLENLLAIFPKGTDEKMVINLYNLQVVLYSNSKKDYHYSYSHNLKYTVGLENNNIVYLFCEPKFSNYLKKQRYCTISLTNDYMDYKTFKDLVSDAEIYKNNIWRRVNAIPKNSI